jgi:hypothetical protein
VLGIAVDVGYRASLLGRSHLTRRRRTRKTRGVQLEVPALDRGPYSKIAEQRKLRGRQNKLQLLRLPHDSRELDIEVEYVDFAALVVAIGDYDHDGEGAEPEEREHVYDRDGGDRGHCGRIEALVGPQEHGSMVDYREQRGCRDHPEL